MKKLLTIALALVLVCALATASAATKLVIGASSTPHAEILEAAKDLLAAKDIDLLIRESIQGQNNVEQGYFDFCAALDKVLNQTADEVADRTNESLAYDAIHFALISYAANVACSRYVAQLRQQKEAQQAPVSKKSKAKKEHD